MPGKLKTAVVGLGFMGGTHIEALRRIGIDVVGALGVTPEETQGGVARYGLAKGYASLDELVADPAVDVVHVCTPNYLHHAQVKAAIQAGKHVICEKPLAVTSAESRELVALARQHHRVGAVNYNLRFFPLAHEAHSRVQAGSLGEIRLVHGRYLQDWLLYPTDWNWRLESDQGGSMRAVTDIGTHWFDLLTWISGLKITAVFADLATVIPTRYKPSGEVETYSNMLGGAEKGQAVAITTDDYATILLRFENGARGVLTVSQVSAGHKNGREWEINGAESSLAWSQDDPNNRGGLPRPPNEVLAKTPPCWAARRAATRAIRRARGGLPETFKQMFRRCMVTSRRATSAPRLPSPPSPAGTPRSCCATRSRAATRKSAGSRSARSSASETSRRDMNGAADSIRRSVHILGTEVFVVGTFN
jgi:predicted dehydrogenase